MKHWLRLKEKTLLESEGLPQEKGRSAVDAHHIA